MKKLLSALLIISLFGCKPPLRLNESYIKTNIQEHTTGSTSSIKIRNIARQLDLISGSFLEISGYDNNGARGVVIGVRSKAKRDSLVVMFPYVVVYDNFVTLNMEQVNEIMEKVPVLKKSTKGIMLKTKEAIYYDYAFKENFYLSYSKGDRLRGGLINFWVNNVKYSIPISKLKLGLKKFIKNK